MKVRMLVSIAGHAEPKYGLGEFSFSPGDVVDLDKKLAKAWIDVGHAEKDTRVLADAETETTGESA